MSNTRTSLDPATGEAITHGFGWAYVAATITEEKEVPADEEITRSELRRMIETGRVVVEEGVEYVVTGVGAALASGALVVDTVEDAANVAATTAGFISPR